MNLDGEGFLEWAPVDEFTKKYDIYNISWQTDSIVFVLVDKECKSAECQKKIELIWNLSDLISYHVTDETYREDCWGKTEEFNKEGRFFARKKSLYVDRMKAMSPLFPKDAIHFTIIGTNTVVDIIAKDYPEMK